MKNPFRDWPIALRGLTRHPAFALAAITTLALGVGANTAVFSMVHGVLLQPLPYPNADQLALLTGTSQISVLDAADWRARSHTLATVAAFVRQWDVGLTGSGEPQRLAGSVVEPDLFTMLGVAPLRGRLLENSDNRLGAPRVATISERLWTRQFGRDPNVLGRTVVLNERAATIVGVLPPAADVFGDNIDVWLPIATETPWALTQRGTNNLDAIGRIRDGVQWGAVRREMADISSELARTYPETNKGKVAAPLPLLDALVGDVRAPILVLEIAVLILLMLVVANLVGLFIARGSARGPEVVLRMALGAHRAELAMLLSAEGGIVAVAGGAIGIAFGLAARSLVVSELPASLPRAGNIQVDWPVAAFMLVLIAAAGLVVGIVPALHALRWTRATRSRAADLAPDTRRGQRLLSTLVTAEIAMAVVVLALSTLLGRTFVALERVHPGFESAQVVAGELVLPESRYSEVGVQSRTFRAVLERLAASPGVEAAGSVIGLPLGPGGGIGHGLAVEGQPPASPGAAPSVRVRPVGGDYFRVLRIPIRAGRSFTSADDERAVPVAIVNEALARQLWPTESPIDHRIRWVGADGTPPWMTIVGVVGDTRTNGLMSGDQPAVYLPYAQHTESWVRWGTLVVRGPGDPAQLARAMRAAVGEVDPLIPIGDVTRLTDYRAAAMGQQRLEAIVLAAFALSALLIAVQGIYGTLAYIVAQRRREIAIRMAVGATPGAVRSAIVARGMRAVAIGTAVGLVVAFAAGHAIRGLLYGVSADDPLSYMVVVCVIVAAALCGALLPARRASRADPLSTLRTS